MAPHLIDMVTGVWHCLLRLPQSPSYPLTLQWARRMIHSYLGQMGWGAGWHWQHCSESSPFLSNAESLIRTQLDVSPTHSILVTQASGTAQFSIVVHAGGTQRSRKGNISEQVLPQVENVPCIGCKSMSFTANTRDWSSSKLGELVREALCARGQSRPPSLDRWIRWQDSTCARICCSSESQSCPSPCSPF